MKKIILVPAILGVMGIGGVMAIAFEKTSSANNDKILTFEEIEKKALAVINGNVKDIDLESNGFKSYYEVEIITDDAEYELKLDASSGELLKKTKEALDYEDLKVEKTLTNEKTTTEEILTIEEIKKKALAVVNGTITDIELEQKGTKSYYEVEVVTNDAEYDLKLDATSGELLKKTKEALDYEDLYDDDSDDDDDRDDD